MKRLILFFSIFLLGIFSAYAQEQDVVEKAAESDIEENSELVFNRYTPGLIFNTSNILLDISGYQSGVGLKLKAEDYALRTLLRLSYESADDVFESELGFTYEKPFFKGKVSPYWGVELKGGYSLDKDEVTSDNWTSDSVITGSLSALFGTELYIFDFLSFFAEYSIGGSLSRATYTSVVSGNKSDTTNLNYYLGTGLGNSASIGVIIYLERIDIAEDKSGKSEKE